LKTREINHRKVMTCQLECRLGCLVTAIAKRDLLAGRAKDFSPGGWVW
jgi:hypothetical protein